MIWTTKERRLHKKKLLMQYSFAFIFFSKVWSIEVDDFSLEEAKPSNEQNSVHIDEDKFEPMNDFFQYNIFNKKSVLSPREAPIRVTIEFGAGDGSKDDDDKQDSKVGSKGDSRKDNKKKSAQTRVEKQANKDYDSDYDKFELKSTNKSKVAKKDNRESKDNDKQKDKFSKQKEGGDDDQERKEALHATNSPSMNPFRNKKTADKCVLEGKRCGPLSPCCDGACVLFTCRNRTMNEVSLSPSPESEYDRYYDIFEVKSKKKFKTAKNDEEKNKDNDKSKDKSSKHKGVDDSKQEGKNALRSPTNPPSISPPKKNKIADDCVLEGNLCGPRSPCCNGACVLFTCRSRTMDDISFSPSFPEPQGSRRPSASALNFVTSGEPSINSKTESPTPNNRCVTEGNKCKIGTPCCGSCEFLTFTCKSAGSAARLSAEPMLSSRQPVLAPVSSVSIDNNDDYKDTDGSSCSSEGERCGPSFFGTPCCVRGTCDLSTLTCRRGTIYYSASPATNTATPSSFSTTAPPSVDLAMTTSPSTVPSSTMDNSNNNNEDDVRSSAACVSEGERCRFLSRCCDDAVCDATTRTCRLPGTTHLPPEYGERESGDNNDDDEQENGPSFSPSNLSSGPSYLLRASKASSVASTP